MTAAASSLIDKVFEGSVFGTGCAGDAALGGTLAFAVSEPASDFDLPEIMAVSVPV